MIIDLANKHIKIFKFYHFEDIVSIIATEFEQFFIRQTNRNFMINKVNASSNCNF